MPDHVTTTFDEEIELGEAGMREFVEKYFAAQKPHEEEAALKRIRLHHRVLCQISFNAYKLLFDEAEIVLLNKGQTLYKQRTPIKDVYFVLYGALQVSLNISGTASGVINIGDMVRGGNIVGEEGFFNETP